MVEERGATATNPKMMSRQHIGSDSSRRYRCKRSGRVRIMQDGGVIPATGFPRYGGMAIEERAKTSLENGANTSISYNTHAFVHGRRLGVIPLKRAFSGRIESERCRGSSPSRYGSGSSGTCFVVVHIP